MSVPSRNVCLPQWWLGSYVLLFVLFIAVVALLISLGATATAAAVVPITISGAAVTTVRRLRALATPSRSS